MLFKQIIALSLRHKPIIGLLILGLIGGGLYSLKNIPIDAVPDITNNQVQVVTVSPSLSPQEVEKFITYPVEIGLRNLPEVVEVRSISRYGLSVITIVFEDQVKDLDARQLVKEQLDMVSENIPSYMGKPELMPITTGLGEIYQYVIVKKPGYEDRYNTMDLRSIQDWIIKRQLGGIKGIIDVSSFGGLLKEYEVSVNPLLLQSTNTTMNEVLDALKLNNQNSGSSYIEDEHYAYYIRTEGMVKDLNEIRQIVIKLNNGVPVLVRDVAEVKFGSAKRYGAMTMDGKGEVVGGITLMLKGANSSQTISNVQERIMLIKKSLPEGLDIYPYLDRSVLVGKTIQTVSRNLIEGGIIVILILVLVLGNIRAGLIVASVIPLSMMFALIGMYLFDVSANLMSLGAIDFGIVVDGAVIIVEAFLHFIAIGYLGKSISKIELDSIIETSTARIYQAAAFGVLIILVVFIPIYTLEGIEGKMFRPMAQTLGFAILGSLILSITYVPVALSLTMPRIIKPDNSISQKFVAILKKIYLPVLDKALVFPKTIISLAVIALIASLLLFSRMGSVFIPTLEEGDLAMQMSIQPGSSLNESIRTATAAEKILIENFPEVKHVVSKIGTAEIPTDPMGIEEADIMIILDEKENWVSAKDREELADLMKEKLEALHGVSFEFTQPIQLRFNELMTGVKTDISVKIFGDDLHQLKYLADRAANLIENIPGASDVKVEQTEGLQQLIISYDRNKIAQYGLNIDALNTSIRSAIAGEPVSKVFEGERQFDLVLRLHEDFRQTLNIANIFVSLPHGSGNIPISEVASIRSEEGPNQISRENNRRRINIGINVRNRDIASLVKEIEDKLSTHLKLPAGYYIRYGGQFENLQSAKARLLIAVPAALILIIFLLYMAFNSFKESLMIFIAIPFAAIGGILALFVRDMPFSISAGIGFIALFGVAVLDGIVLMSHFKFLKKEGMTDLSVRVRTGALDRLRPVVITTLVATLGFLPMALSTTNGAEVQRPLATVVIGGLISATFLTLLVLPAIYILVEKYAKRKINNALILGLVIFVLPFTGHAQQRLSEEETITMAIERNPILKQSALETDFARVGKKEIMGLGNLDFNFQRGQINYPGQDNFIEINQNIENPLALSTRKELVNQQIKVGETRQLFTKEQISLQARQAYAQWMYQYYRNQIISDQVSLFEIIRRKADAQLKSGDIGALDKSFVDLQLAESKQRLIINSRELQEAMAILKQVSFIDINVELVPSDSLKIEWLALQNLDEINSTIIQLQDDRRQLAVNRQTLSKRELMPDIYAGYFNQSLDGLKGFQGWQAGLQIPIFAGRERANIQRENIMVKMLQEEISIEQQMYRSRLKAMLTQWSDLQNEIPELEVYREQPRKIKQSAQLQLELGEIDYVRFAQYMQAALNAELNYLELLLRMKNTLNEIKFLSN
jgi:heavy metal efflux system protein